jgi:hypothetical protein
MSINNNGIEEKVNDTRVITAYNEIARGNHISNI